MEKQILCNFLLIHSFIGMSFDFIFYLTFPYWFFIIMVGFTSTDTSFKIQGIVYAMEQCDDTGSVLKSVKF